MPKFALVAMFKRRPAAGDTYKSLTGNAELQELWKQVEGKSVLDVLWDRENPLPNIIKDMEVDLELGGYFVIRKVLDRGYLLDYEILIPSVQSEE